MKTKFQKLVVSLLVAIMFLTSNGTLALAVEINEIAEANEVVVENVVETNETSNVVEDLQPETTEEIPEEETIAEEENLNVSEEVESVVEEQVAPQEDNATIAKENIVDEKVNTTENETVSVEEVKVEEVKLNKDTKTFTGSANSVNVKVVAQPGTFPEGTTMEVTSVDKKDVEDAVEAIVKDNVYDMKAVDISFYADGKEVEPLIDVNVELTTSAMNNKEDLNVVHIQDSGKIEVMDLTNASKTTAEFKAESFSVYVVVDSGNDARLLVKFMNGSSEIASMYVKDGDDLEQVLYDPGVGEIANNVYFKGWTQDDGYEVARDGKITPAAKTIADVRTEVGGLLPPAVDADAEGAEPVIYYAVLVKKYTIDYLDENNVSLGSHEIVFRADSTTTEYSYTVNKAYTPQDNEHDFEGWFVADGGSNITDYDSSANNGKGTIYTNETEITIKGDVTFSVNAPAGHWLVFDEVRKGATYSAPQFVLTGEGTKQPRPNEEMLLNGYTFGGWYADADYTTPFTFGGTITDTTTIYAKWNPKTTAGYTILIWKQNVKADGYDFAESITGTGTVGNNINAVTESGSGDGRYASVNGTAKRYTGFHLNNYDTNIQIVPEGTAVLNVYYNRNEITLTFRYRSGNSWQTQTTMTGLYGQTLASKGYTWPTNRWWYDDYSSGMGGYSGAGTRTTFLDAFILSDGSSSQTFYGFTGNGTRTVHFLKQNASGTGYTEANTATTSNGTFYISDKYNGFKAAQYSTNNTTWTTLGNKDSDGYYGSVGNYTNLYIRYDRLTYSILYYDGVYVNGNGEPVEGYSNRGKLNEVDGIVYESNIASYNKGGANYYEPTFNNFVFGGWYLDDACTQAYTFGTMPEGIRVYAKWVQTQYRVFLHPNAGTDPTLDWGKGDDGREPAMNFRVSSGEKVSAPTGVRLEYEFVGWYSNEGLTIPFNASVTPLNDSNVTTPYDKNQDMTDVMDKWGNGATWNSDITGNNGSDRFWITKKLDLYASWRAKLQGANGINVQYEYQTDDAGNTDIIDDGNSYVDGANASGLAAPSTTLEGKVFDHWVLQTWNGSGYVDADPEKVVYPGENFTVLKTNAHQEILEQETDGTITKAKYTVQLKAVYKDLEEETPTHINWYKNDGSTAFHVDKADGTLSINEAVAIQGKQTKTGYKFLGWSRVDIGSTPEAAAAWEANSSNWTQSLTTPNLLFYKEVDGVGKFYSDAAYTTEATKVAADENTPYHAMFAVWEGNPDELTYDANGGTGSMDPTEGKVGDTVKVAANGFTRAGYTFKEWNTLANPTEENPGTVYAAQNDYVLTPEEDIVYAQWTANTNTEYTVEYYLQNVDNDNFTLDTTRTRTETGTTDTPVDAEVQGYNISITGFTFDRTNANNVLTGTIAGDGSLTLKLYYVRNSANVIYQYTGTVPTGAPTVPATVSYKYGANVTIAAKPTLDGYTFNGWSLTEAFSMPANDVTITGSWVGNPDELTYDGNGATSGSTASTIGRVGDTVQVASNGFIRAGYTFTGWNTAANGSGTAYAAGNDYVLTPGIDKLFAQWIADEDTEYTVEYYFENVEGTAFEKDEDATRTETGTTDTEVDAIALGYNTEFTGFTFDEENENNVLTGTIAGDGSLTLELYYVRNSYEVEYKYEGTIPANAPAVPETKSYKYEEEVQVEAVPSLAGYTFEGWSKSGTFSMPAEKVTITGKWIADEDTEYTVEYYFENVEGTAFEKDEDATRTETGTTDTEVDAIALGYNTEFTGFTFDEENENNVLTGTIAGDGSLTLELYYVRNSYEYSVEYYFDDVHDKTLDETGMSAKLESKVSRTPATSMTHDEKNYTLVSSNYEITITLNSENNVIKIYYELDQWNDEEDDDNKGDDIPDKYQVKVNYQVEKGYWNGEGQDSAPRYEIATLFDKNGKWSDEGTGSVTIPEVGENPAVGYWTGDWKTTPSKEVTIKDNGAVYVYAYVICKPTRHDPPVKKIIYGDADNTDDVFKFTLTAISTTADIDSMPMPEGSNGSSKTVQIKGAGEYEFGIIEFTMPGTYKYKIVEEKTNNSNYEYDNSVYDITYEVYQEEDQLYCDRTMIRNGNVQEDEEIYFMNKYNAPVEADVYENPRTGDNIYVYVIMLVVSTFGIVASVMDDKRRKKEIAE